MKKGTIVIASTLKPVDDTRAFEKFAVAFAKVGYEVFLTGRPPARKTAYPNIHFIPTRNFSRLGLYRLLLPWDLFKKIREVKPEVLIVNTHEILLVAVANRIFFGTRIFYDVQENYFLNLLYSDTYLPGIRHVLAVGVRLKEWLLSFLFDGIFLAEKCYLQELPFMAWHATVVENKAVVPTGFARVPQPGKIRLLFSGTLARTTGVFHAIALAKKLHTLDGRISLNIVGYSPLASTYAQLMQAVRGCSFIHITGGDHLVPHTDIMEAICHADFGIIHYTLTPGTTNRIPTKLYEYLACGLPFVIQNHKPWLDVCGTSNAAIPDDQEAQELLSRMISHAPVFPPGEAYRWEPEAQKLTEALSRYLTA